MIQQTAKSATKNDMFYFGDFWILYVIRFILEIEFKIE